jgi:hypothetical protein
LAGDKILLFDEIVKIPIAQVLTFLLFKRDKVEAENYQYILDKQLNQIREGGNANS